MPRRATTPSFITELPLKTNPQQEEILLKRLNAGRQLYNAVLGEAIQRVQLVRQSKIYRQAKKLRKNDPLRKKLFKQAKDTYQYNEYALHSYATQISHSWVGDHLDANANPPTPLLPKGASGCFAFILKNWQLAPIKHPKR